MENQLLFYVFLSFFGKMCLSVLKRNCKGQGADGMSLFLVVKLFGPEKMPIGNFDHAHAE